MAPLYVHLSAMPAPIRLITTNQKFSIIIWACLAFAVKHPDLSTRIPSKTIEVLFGTTVSAATVKALKNVRWTYDDTIRPVFSTVEHDGTKATDWWVSFDATLLDLAHRLSSEDFLPQIGHGLPDVSRAIFRMAEDELSGELPPWNLEALRAVLYRTVKLQQTPAGSAVVVKPKTCPLCGSRDISTIFYGSPEELHEYRRHNHSAKTLVSVGNDSILGPKPRWECLTCGIKFWALEGTEAV